MGVPVTSCGAQEDIQRHITLRILGLGLLREVVGIKVVGMSLMMTIYLPFLLYQYSSMFLNPLTIDN